jgi:pimeloyl-ACP methyl ester carboxylesterase
MQGTCAGSVRDKTVSPRHALTPQRVLCSSTSVLLLSVPRRTAAGSSRRGAAIVLVLLAIAACGPPIQVRRIDPRQVQRQLTRNVLTSNDLSRRTHNLLYAHDLGRTYDDDPVTALAELHTAFVAGTLAVDDTAALAELSFQHAENGGGASYYLASALYAWVFLFPDDSSATPTRFNPRARMACDLYNRGLTAALKTGGTVDLSSRTLALPFGAVELTVDPQALRWSDHQLIDFVPVAELEVTGFATYYRWSGIGAPLAAGVSHEDVADYDLLAPRAKVPVTVVLRAPDFLRQLRDGHMRAALEVYPGYGETTITVGGQQVPLEAEPTATMALGLAESGVFRRETAGFLNGFGIIQDKTRLVSIRPYHPGLIPVVLVHGTASSAGRWAQMVNDLDNDPVIHARFQFWAFSYETGNPIAYSAMLLREALEHAVAQLDPDGHDPALRQMVVIGHSQGGLLTKTTVVESGSRFWDNISHKPFAQVTLRDSTRDLLQRGLFIHPLPFVRRVVFIATPHHGSYIAGSWFAHQIARLVKAPLDLTKTMAEMATIDRDALAINGMRGLPTSVDNMTPGNPFVRTLADLPIAPGVHAHSIIAVDGKGPPGGNDGVVAYDSAHIDGVESELVVRSPHSCQSNPHTIAEVKRILLEHLSAAEVPPPSPPAPDMPSSPPQRRVRRARAL